MPTLPLTQMDDRVLAADLDNRVFTLTFGRPVPIQDLLLLLVRGTKLSVVPDPAITGSFIGELKDVTVREALGLILQPLGLDYAVSGGLIRVFRREPERRLFDVNYIATQRVSTVTVGTGPRAGSTSQVSSTTTTDLFADLAKGVQPLLSDRGTLSIDRKAGVLQVIDFPERLERVSVYLEAIQSRVHRQVQVDIRVVDVELHDGVASLNWTALSQAAIPGAASSASPRGLTGLRVTDVPRLLAALGTQGRVSTIADPRILALNNEPAIVRSAAQRHGEVTMTVTAQIGSDGIVMLHVSPLLSRTPPPPARDKKDPKDRTEPDGHVLIEADMLARVASGESVVVTGFPALEDEVTSTAGGQPKGRPLTVTRKRSELVILLTPTILQTTAD